MRGANFENKPMAFEKASLVLRVRRCAPVQHILSSKDWTPCVRFCA
jgi:hypothetical protein